MNKNPLNQGVLIENGVGIGAVSRNIIRERAVELVLINGRLAQDATKADLEQAKHELTVGQEKAPKRALLDAATESDRWNPVPGSSGLQSPASPSEDEDANGRGGCQGSHHDQMLQAAQAAGKKDEVAS